MVNITKKVQHLFDLLPYEAENVKLCGIDEAGRGPLAGPLVVAGVILEHRINGLGDSKRMSAKRREQLYSRILERSRHHLVIVEADQIDVKGLSQCLREAIKEIIDHLSGDDVHFLFDGNSSFGVEGVATLVKADMKVPEVGAASILAKVTRDRIMLEMASSYPGYGFDRNKGYGTPEHLEAIEKHGLTPIHRRSYRIRTLKREATLF